MIESSIRSGTTYDGRALTRYQVLYWQDVPSLVRIFSGDGEHVSHQLPDWFQQEIDRRAMEQGLVGSDAYLEEWRWGEPEERPESPDELVAVVAEEFRTSR
jgi:hypothetical protein